MHSLDCVFPLQRIEEFFDEVTVSGVGEKLFHAYYVNEDLNSFVSCE